MISGWRLILGLVVALFASLAILGAAYFVAKTPDEVFAGQVVAVAKVTPGTQKVDYHLKENISAATIGRELQKLGIIRSGPQFELLVSLMGVSGQLSAGDYELTKGTSTLTVIQAVTVKSSVPTLKVTFPEGIRFEEMADIAEKAGFGNPRSREFTGDIVVADIGAPPEIMAAVLRDSA